MPRSAKKPTSATAPHAGQSAAPVTGARVQPITTPTGLPYGEAKALADAQRQLPVPGAPAVGASAVAPVPSGMGAGAGPGNGGMGIDAAVAAAQGHDFAPVGLGQPTLRPNEPLTAGLPTGPGPGPEALQPSPQIPSALAQGAAVLNALGAKISPEARQLRDLINASIHNQSAQ